MSAQSLSLIQRAQFLRTICDTTATPSRAAIEILKPGATIYFNLPSDTDVPLTIFVYEERPRK